MATTYTTHILLSVARPSALLSDADRVNIAVATGAVRASIADDGSVTVARGDADPDETVFVPVLARAAARALKLPVRAIDMAALAANASDGGYRIALRLRTDSPVAFEDRSEARAMLASQGVPVRDDSARAVRASEAGLTIG